MSGRKNIVWCGLVLIAFGSFGLNSSQPEKNLVHDFKNTLKDTSLTKKNRQDKKDASPRNQIRPGDVDTLVNDETGVTITQSTSIEQLSNNEVYIPPTLVKREYVLEEDFKLWRIFVQKGDKTTEYWKAIVPYGTFFQKNDVDISEELFIHETKDLPEGEAKRYMRDEFAKKERERINKELLERFQIRSISMDSLNLNKDTLDQNSPDNSSER